MARCITLRQDNAPPNEAHTIPVAQFDAAMKILQDALRD